MREIFLKHQLSSGEWLEVQFDPDRGMNFTSYKKGELEILDQSTRPLFEERMAGLGALIGPHFHHRKVIPAFKDETLFPHIAAVKERGGQEFFSHGIARYVPWKVTAQSESKIEAVLSGDDLYGGVALKDIEGQNFKMGYLAELKESGLKIILDVVSDTDSIVGLHTYYALAGGTGPVTAKVSPNYNDAGMFKPITDWEYAHDHTLHLVIDRPYDFGFSPTPDPLSAQIMLKTPTHDVRVSYSSNNEENSFQIWHPKGASFVCIEPLSAKDPRHPHLSVSQIEIEIEIL